MNFYTNKVIIFYFNVLKKNFATGWEVLWEQNINRKKANAEG